MIQVSLTKWSAQHSYSTSTSSCWASASWLRSSLASSKLSRSFPAKRGKRPLPAKWMNEYLKGIMMENLNDDVKAQNIYVDCSKRPFSVELGHEAVLVFEVLNCLPDAFLSTSAEIQVQRKKNDGNLYLRNGRIEKWRIDISYLKKWHTYEMPD